MEWVWISPVFGKFSHIIPGFAGVPSHLHSWEGHGGHGVPVVLAENQLHHTVLLAKAAHHHHLHVDQDDMDGGEHVAH